MQPPDDEEMRGALERRVAELEAEIARREREAQRHLTTEQRLRCLLDASWDGVAISEGGVIIEANEKLAEIFGYSLSELVGVSPPALHPPAWRDVIRDKMASGYDKPYEVVGLRKDGSTFPAEVSGRSIRLVGRPARVATVRDLSRQKRAEEALRVAAVREEVIRAQAALLLELSTPLLPIAPGVLVLPLVGAVRDDRARRVLEVLTAEIARVQAAVAILDITGVPEVDAGVVAALVAAARSARLLGARLILTGVRPGVARRFLELGADLQGIVTCGTLERGVARALGGS